MIKDQNGNSFEPEELIDLAEDHFQENEKYWMEKEAEILDEETVCVIITVHSFPFMYIVGDSDLIARWSRLEDYRILAIVMQENPRTFLDNKDDDKLGITSGYWACECKTNFVKTSFTTFCKKCNTGISKPSDKCKVIM